MEDAFSVPFILSCFLVNGKEIKTTLFADDMTYFLRDTNSYFQILTSLQNFARYSGLRVNYEKKTEIFAVLVRTLLFKMFLLTKYVVWSNYWEFISIMIPQLGWRPTVTPSLNQGLTLIQTVKSFIIPKFLSKAALISESVPDDQVKEINKLMYYFGCVRLGNLDVDFKIRISDFQSKAKSENGFQRRNICFWIFLFTVRLGNQRKELKNCPLEQRSCMRTHN